MKSLTRLVAPLVILALVVVGALTLLGGDDQKTLTAQFPRTIAVYEGSEVRVLGVPIGKVEEVTPSGTKVVVKMRYDSEIKIPVGAEAVIIAPSVVGDRFIQLTPVYTGGDVLADGTILDEGSTSVPLELDQVYSSLDRLNVALGPNGANRNGALSDLLETTADNFAGQGARFHQTIKDFGKLSGTLENNKEELFGSAAELEQFIGTLARNDQTVRDFNTSLAAGADLLAGERQELSASLRNLSVALSEVGTFVRENRDILGKNISGLKRVAAVLVKQRSALDEVLRLGPLALSNLFLTYNPQTGTLDTRSNQGQAENQLESDPAVFLCGIVEQADDPGDACEVIEEIFPRPGALAPGERPVRDQFDPTLGGLVEVTS